MPGTLLASVVVLSRNRAPSLARTLASLRSQTFSGFEIVVVDNGSTDCTPQVARAYGARHVLVSPRYGIGYCRQVGFEAAEGEIVAYCDDDCIPSPDWLEQLVSYLRSNPQVGLVGGKVINVGFTGYRRFKGRTKYFRNGKLTYAKNDDETEYYGNMSIAVRRSVMQEIGGYDPFMNVMEEIDLAARVRSNGYGVDYEPAAVLEHYNAGVFFKSRRFFYGVQLVRLYFFMKHYKPTSIQEWLKFVGYEAEFLGLDLQRAIRALVAATLYRKPERYPIIAVELFNVLSARFSLPWIIYIARRRARFEKSFVESKRRHADGVCA